MVSRNFLYDVFISYASEDRDVVRSLADKLKADGLKVWFDLWELRSISSNAHFQRLAISNGLKNSRTLLLCLSKSLFKNGSVQAEQSAIIFRDPLNEGRRLIPILLEEASVPPWLSDLLHVDWRYRSEQAYLQIRDASLPPRKTVIATAGSVPRLNPSIPAPVAVLSGKTIRTFSISDEDLLFATFGGEVWRIDKSLTRLPELVWNPGGRITSVTGKFSNNNIAACRNGSLMLASKYSSEGRNLVGHDGPVLTVASLDENVFYSGGADGTVRAWNFKSGALTEVFRGHTGAVRVINVSQRLIVSGAHDSTVRLWNHAGQCLRVLEGHTGEVSSLTLANDDKFLISGSRDNSIRTWDASTGLCYQVLEGHTDYIATIALHTNQRHALSGSGDRTLRLWDLATGHCLRVLDGHRGDIAYVRWTGENTAISGDEFGFLSWTFKGIDFASLPIGANSKEENSGEAQIQYTNAKVLLVGESGAGKSSLSIRLASNQWDPNTDSTMGAWATQWKLPVISEQNIEKEIWLWDFGGQSDQRLIHQLYMADAALAVLVFNGQKDDLFDSLGQWDRDVCRASPNGLAKILVAARSDAGGLKFSQTQIDDFVTERGFSAYLQTSAKTGVGCSELRHAIIEKIDWDRIPWRSSPILFKRLKDKIVHLKEAGQILMRFNDLSSRLRLELDHSERNFTDEQLRAVLNLLSGPGVVSELEFGGWVLFRPELLNAYGQALIRTIRDDPSELGTIAEDRLLNGDLNPDTLPAIPKDDEQYILLDLHKQLIAKGLCLRQPTTQGNILVLPAFYRRRRPNTASLPAVLVTYDFDGYSDEIHATLVVHLVHTNHFRQENLWHDGADFVTRTARKRIGIKFTPLREGKGRIEVYANLDIGNGQLIQFIGYVHEHLKQKATNVKRTRHYVCTGCGTPVESHIAVAKRLEMGKDYILCGVCEEKVLLWDELEEIYNSPSSNEEVRKLEQKISIALDNESKERILVGEVISTVALANQLSREKTVSDHGIDMEIEFKDSKGQASGKIIYLQLKSGDSHLRTRQKDGALIFDIKDSRHTEYWMNQTNPVYLVIRNSKGDISWMEIRDHLKELTEARERDYERGRITQIEFKGEQFNAQNILRIRNHLLR
ncbi:TIR domain-containing protein [Massilia sp. IC2-278]|uniref:TIR domain-containing protein n=1 Tax=Massilia sp. IC2-278 TaxID=2887200 RepID=UPI001E5E530E|nr:TIR domain-containing protein [Massilia sp. IC2-278]MCC2961776.1 TIR domain-containing protein [Massilia sp. IC2-278]